MNVIWSFYREERLRKRRKRRRFLVCVILIAGLLPWAAWKTFHSSHAFVSAVENPVTPQDFTIAHTDEPEEIGPEAVPPAEPEGNHVFTRTIADGDTLSAIFDDCGISRNVMYRILSADEPLLALDVLHPGHVLTFTLDRDTRELIGMELFVHPGKRIHYARADDGGFDYEEIIIPGEWNRELIDGDIAGSFYLSARNAGLSDQETGNIIELFRDHIQFAREMQNGDNFQVVRSRQFVDGEFTGRSRIDGVRIFRGKRLYSAFLFEDGNYYDYDGKSLARALRRYPMAGSPRITSHFSRARRHPVTGRITPHYGVDFAMPTGTPVFSTGDGVVTRVHNHPFAGKYVEIRHGSQYITRYLHLSRILVRRGQSVQRGERIALSGNTGRSTGPHLHFELHVNGRPVNPLTAKIPMASSVPEEKKDDFSRRVGELVGLMERPTREIVLNRAEDLPGKASTSFSSAMD